MGELISIGEAAERLGVRPWEVIRLMDAGALRQVVLIDMASLTEYQESQ